MQTRLTLDILPQPDETTCGPTSLHAVYRYYGDDIPLQQVIDETHVLEGGGTLEVLLALHALHRGYRAIIYTYNLRMFDPTWFQDPAINLAKKLCQQQKIKRKPKLGVATEAYLEFLRLGGKVRFQDLTSSLLRKYLKQEKPILCGLSSTFLYHSAREHGDNMEYDDIRGNPAGHFVVLCGYDMEHRNVLVADPMQQNPMARDHIYEVNIDRLICSILLGPLTYDGSLLILEPGQKHKKGTSP